MLHPDAALKIINGLKLPNQTEEIPLDRALGRVPAAEILSPLESPPFDKAAMDGYALQADDSSPCFKVVETVAAGQVPRFTVNRGECARIMTGAMLPEGANKVIRVEYTREQEGLMTPTRPEPAGNIIARGENLKKGDRVLEKRILAPQDIGILASLGIARIRVALPPRIGIMATGTELRAPGEPLQPGQIYNSNGPQLCAQVARLSCPHQDYGIISDDPPTLAETIRKGLEECDLLLLSGGVSMGTFDYVPGTLKKLGARILFHKLAVKPGKPALFARQGGSFAFGMPGNPVSSFIIFELLVKPFLFRWQGLDFRPQQRRARLGRSFQRKSGERVEYRPVKLVDDEIVFLTYHGSAHLNALAEAGALLRIEQGITSLEEGEMLYVRLL